MCLCECVCVRVCVSVCVRVSVWVWVCVCVWVWWSAGVATFTGQDEILSNNMSHCVPSVKGSLGGSKCTAHGPAMRHYCQYSWSDTCSYTLLSHILPTDAQWVSRVLCTLCVWVCVCVWVSVVFLFCVSLTIKGSGGTAHTCSGRHSQYSCELLARYSLVPRLSHREPCTHYMRLVHRCPGSVIDPLWGS